MRNSHCQVRQLLDETVSILKLTMFVLLLGSFRPSLYVVKYLRGKTELLLFLPNDAVDYCNAGRALHDTFSLGS